MTSHKKTKEEMIVIAYELQDALIAELHKKPCRIITNKDFSVIRISWGQNYEKKDWHNQEKIDAIIEEFKKKYSIHIREIGQEEDTYSSVWLTKAENDPHKDEKNESGKNRKLPGAPKIKKTPTKRGF